MICAALVWKKQQQMSAHHKIFMAWEVCHETLCDPDNEERRTVKNITDIKFIFLFGLNVNSMDDLSDYTLTGKTCSAIGFLCKSMSVWNAFFRSSCQSEILSHSYLFVSNTNTPY